MAVELRIVNPDGSDGEMLPDWSNLTFSQDLLNAGTLSFEYAVEGINANLLDHTLEMSVKLDGIEPLNGRFIYDSDQGSRIAEADGPSVTIGATSIIDQGSKFLMAPAFGSNFADDNLFAFTDKTAGWLVQNCINNYMSRANAKSSLPTWLVYPITTFSNTLDSSGKSWSTTYDVTFKSGDSLSTVLDWLTTNGFAEPAMIGNQLYLYEPANNGRDLSLSPNVVSSDPVTIMTGRDFTEATYETTSKDLVTSLLVLGDNNSCVWVTDDAAIAEYGYREGTMNVSNASTVATLTAAGQAYMSVHNIPRFSYTYSVAAEYIDQLNQSFRPFIDYQVGDHVLILDGVSTSVQRVKLLSATWPTADAATIAISVNDIFDDRETELDRRLSRLGI